MKKIISTICVFLLLVLVHTTNISASTLNPDEYTQFGSSSDTRRTSSVGWSTLGYWVSGRQMSEKIIG